MNPFLEDVDSFAIPIADEPLVQKDTLGSPIGRQSFVSSTVKGVIDNIAGTMVKCRKLENPQDEMLLLRKSFTG
jgi:hypothetical protein